MKSFLAAMLAVNLAGSVAAAEPSIRLRALPGTVRIGPQQSFFGSDTVKIACARGESESFQVVVTAMGVNLSGVEVEMTQLRGESGNAIDATDCEIFKEEFVPVRHSVRRATVPPGLLPDPLVPFKNPYTGEPVRAPKWGGNEVDGAMFGAAGFEVWEGRNEPLWIDVHVPKDAVAGTYRGTFKVSAIETKPAEIPVEVVVWDFVLPDGPTHENHFGGVGRVAAYFNLSTASEEYQRIEARFIEMMANHRINPPLPHRLRPTVAEDGVVSFDEEMDQLFAEFMEKHHVTNVDVPGSPFSQTSEEDREKTCNYYRSWYAYLEGKGWEKGAYLYMLDEPNDATAYERVRDLGALVQEAEPRLRRVVVEQPYTQDPEWGTLDGSLDIWCPLFGFIHEPSVKRVQEQGDEVWSYTALVQRPPSEYYPDFDSVDGEDPPYWQIDFPVTAYRIAPWLNRRYGITGLLYWSTVCWSYPDRNPWHDPGFRINFNGEGSLFYPGTDAGIEGPIASIRLKNLRDGMEDYEYFAILADLGGEEVVEEIVREAVPTWGTWKQDPYLLPELRRRLAEEILKRRN